MIRISVNNLVFSIQSERTQWVVVLHPHADCRSPLNIKKRRRKWTVSIFSCYKDEGGGSVISFTFDVIVWSCLIQIQY